MKQRIPVWRKDKKLQRLNDTPVPSLDPETVKSLNSLCVHLFALDWEPLTAFHDPYTGKIVRMFKPHRVLRCHECRDWRWASKLKVQAYGDGLRIKCADGCYGERAK